MADDFDPSLKGLDLTGADLAEVFERMKRTPVQASRDWQRQRGYGLEVLLQALLRREALDPRPPYRISGEQVDGSFVLDGRVHLLEAKWVSSPLPASTVYAFKGKVAGKLVGTIGFMISISGYAPDAVDAVSLGKTLDVLLVDGNDLQAVLTGADSILQLFRRKLRAAAEDGIVYLPKISARQVGRQAAGQGGGDGRAGERGEWSENLSRNPFTLVVVTTTAMTVSDSRSLVGVAAPPQEALFIGAGGTIAAVRLAHAVERASAGRARIVLIVSLSELADDIIERPPVGAVIIDAGNVRSWTNFLADSGAQVKKALTSLSLNDPTFAAFMALVNDTHDT